MFSSRPRVALSTRALLALGLATGLMVGVGASAADGPSGQIDLTIENGAHLDGAGFLDGAATTVAPAGDVNNDGRPDLIVGAPFRDGPGGFDSGAAYVIFGTSATRTVDFADLGSAGFAIEGEAGGDRAGISVASAGDVNNDGRDDLIVGANGNDRTGTNSEGAAYVVFGKADSTPVSLAALGAGGYKILGAFAGDRAGASVAGVGDVNADGLDDVAVGAPDADDNPLEVVSGDRENAGTVFVVHGQAATTPVDLAALTAGYVVAGATVDQAAGTAISGLGDINADGRADLLVGAPGTNPSGRAEAGAAYVIYSPAAAGGVVDIAALGASGYGIAGAVAGDRAGTAVSGAGDINGDGGVDMLVGAPAASPLGRAGAGTAYVVFGGTTGVDLNAPGSRAAVFTGAAAGDAAGSALASPGDLNADGVGDVLIGAPGAQPSGRTAAGAAYLLTTVATGGGDLAGLGADGLTVIGAASSALGTSVAGPGDLNGDGKLDLVAGAPGAAENGRTGSGSAYLLLGLDEPGVAYAPTRVVQGTPVSMVPTLFSTGPATITVAPPLPDGLSIDPSSGAITGTPTAAGSSTHAVTVTDATGTTRVTLIFNIGAPGSTPPFSGSVSSAPLCAVTPAVADKSGEPGKVTLTARQLRINQRIGQAAIRRLNAIETWLASGVENRDLCGGSIGAEDLADGISIGADAPSTLAGPSPRPLVVAPAASKPAAKIVVSKTQLLINQRIYQAAVRRARALDARLDGALTGGDLADGAVTEDKLASGLDVVAAPAQAPIPPSKTAKVAAKGKGDASKVKATVGQLRTNQRIAQGAVKQANRLRAVIGGGLTGANFADGAITSADLAPEVVAP